MIDIHYDIMQWKIFSFKVQHPTSLSYLPGVGGVGVYLYV